MMIVAGSTLPCWRPYLKEFSIQYDVFSHTGNFTYKKPANIRKVIIDQALKYYNAPYLWGGRSPFGIDCSGLTQIVFKLCGFQLKRDAYQQAEQGNKVNGLEQT